MAVYKTVPNQKVVKVSKEGTKNKIFAQIEMGALEAAAQALGAGAFKLWVYFAKNQNGYEFALSSREVENSFGMKIKQYNGAIAELEEKGYLVKDSGNKYTFNEIAVMPKQDNEKTCVIPKSNNGVMPKEDNQLYQKEIRNITDTTNNNTQGELTQPAAKISSLADAQEEEEVVGEITEEALKRMGASYEKLSGNKVKISGTGKLFKIK